MSELYLPELESQINQYFSHQRTRALSKETQKTYRIILYVHLLPFCKEKGISKLDQDFVDHMDDYIDYLRAKGCTGQTIQGYITVTKLLYRFHGKPIMYSYRIPREDKQAFDLKHERRWFTDRHVALSRTYQFKSNNARNHILVRLLTETGGREDEIAHIKVGDVDIRKNEILITHSKTTARTVFISEETAIHIENYFKSKFPDPVESALTKIFPGKNQIYKIITAMLKDLGLKTSVDGRGPHTFRHYVATDLYFVKNMPLTDVAFIMGDTPPTIEKNYLHPTTAMLHNRMKKASGW